jgi:transposase
VKERESEMRKFREYNMDQLLLMPPDIREWLPEDHLAYFISDVAEELDLGEIYEAYNSSEGGQPAYHPLMMVKILLYGYSVGVASSRKIERKLREDVAFRVLSAGSYPDHDTIAEFRKRHLGALSKMFIQVLEMCQKAGLVKLGHIAIDGTKMKGNASKHKAMSYGRMREKEEELRKKVEEVMKKAEDTDEEEDKKYGKGKRGDELPEELRFHKKRLEKIREAKAALEKEAKERKPEGLPEDKVQRNFTDPESRIMKDSASKSFIQGYNSQAAVDWKSQIIVAADAMQVGVDKEQLKPMLEEVKENTDEYPKEVSADAGYYSEENVKYAEGKGIETYIAPERLEHGEWYRIGVVRGRKPKGLGVKELMRRKLRTKKGKKTYSKRKETVEPVFGQIKQVRGFRQFLLRGLEKVRAEWRLICLTHNLLKLFRYG